MTKTTTLSSFQASLSETPDDATPRTAVDCADPVGRAIEERLRQDDPFSGMVLELETDEAYGLIQGKVRAWLDDRGIIAQEDEIRDKTNFLYGRAAGHAQETVRDWRRPASLLATEAEYTLTPDGLVSDYTPIEAERELPGMPGHPEAPAAEPVEPSMLWDPAIWGKVENADEKATLIWKIPQNSDFKRGQFVAFRDDENDLVDYLVRTVRPLRLLADLQIVWKWKAKGGRSDQKPRLISVKTADPDLADERGHDIIVHLSADHLRKMRASSLFMERLVFDALVRMDPAGPKVLRDGEFMKLPGRWRYGWLGPEERLYAGLVSQIAGGHDDDTTVDVDAVTTTTEDPVQRVVDALHGSITAREDGSMVDGAGVLIHNDGTPFTAEEIAAQEAAELRDDPAEFDEDEEYDDSDEDARP